MGYEMGVQNQAVDFSARSLYDIIFGTWLEYVFWFIFNQRNKNKRIFLFNIKKLINRKYS